jgi:hypothetical protein
MKLGLEMGQRALHWEAQLSAHLQNKGPFVDPNTYQMDFSPNVKCPSMHIMLDTCVPNLRGRGWVEHTQMHLVLKKGTKNFHYTSNSYGSLFNFLFHETKIPAMDIKVQVSFTFNKKKIEKKWNLQVPWGLEDLTLPSVGASFRKWRCCTPILLKGLAHSPNFSKKFILKGPQSNRWRATTVTGGRPLVADWMP